ncbi:MAG: type II secretion system F family protein [Actinobacteria bacterium]|nr:MAG: type II secretion system F family protein [Actinomycetota bacterium]
MSAAVFSFRAVDTLGGPVRGELEGPSIEAVTEQLRQRGLTVLGIQPKRTALEISFDAFSRIKSHDLMVMTRQLATMVSAGLTLLRALRVLEEQTESKKLKAALVDVRKNVESGSSLSDALERHPKVFSVLYVSMVRAGETGGFLETTLIRVADHLESEDKLRRQVRSAMVYPTVVLSFAMLVLLAMIGFIVPVFAKVFKENGAQLPGLTRFTLGLSDIVRHYPYLLVGVVVGVVVLFTRWRRTEAGRSGWDRFKLRVPMKIGDIVQKIALARWSRTLSSLVSAGVPMLEAISVTGKTSGNVVVEKAMDSVSASVASGGTIQAALEREPVFPALVHHMVGVGEETGGLEQTLSKVADFYEDEVEAAVKSLTSILEPVMIVVIGSIVGFVVISMYLPMFKVYDAIQ